MFWHSDFYNFQNENGREMASQNPEFDDNCRKSDCGRRRVHLRPPWGPGRPKLTRKLPQRVSENLKCFF